jgi:MFS family permease
MLTAPPQVDVRRVQRRTISLLFVTQIVGGVGVGVGLAVGALLAAAMAGTGVSGLASSFALVFLGALLFGGGTTANLQARYTAVDLAEPARRGRQLSFVVWATTLGAVAGPNLSSLADRAVRAWHVREYAGPFVFSALAFGVAGLLVWLLLRPDPLLVARAVAATSADAPGTDAAGAGGAGLRMGWRAVAADPRARLGMAAVAVGHVVMVGVMSMTPVHIRAGGLEHGAVLRIVGIVLSLHIAGMFAFAPVVGWLTDRLGRRPVSLFGIGLLVTACAVAGTAGHDTVRLSVGLFLLGLGWSGTMVAGSTLLSESVELTVRPAAQGLNDLVMGLGGASAGALSGLVVQLGGYPTLALVSAIATAPLVLLALRPVPAPSIGAASG